MSLMRKQIFGQKYWSGVLLFKTSSTSSTWKINSIHAIIPTNYRVIDNVNGDIVKEGVFHQGDYGISADLSLTSGDCSVEVEVDSTGNGIYYFYVNRNNTDPKLTFIDFGVMPLLEHIYFSNNAVCTVVNSDLLELNDLYLGGGTWNGFDLSQTTKITKLVYRYGVTSDVVFDISNNADLEFLEIWYATQPFNVLNHLKLQHLHFQPVNNVLDVNINNDILPDLRWLRTYYGTNINLDLNNRNLSLLTYFSANIDDLLGLDLMFNIIELWLKTLQSSEGTTVLNIKNLITLTKFNLNYDCAITEVQIDNGLNNQMLVVNRSNTLQVTDLKVDNPTDANNGVSPYDSGWDGTWNFI